jgi:hypothetical protein
MTVCHMLALALDVNSAPIRKGFVGALYDELRRLVARMKIEACMVTH